MVVVVGVVVVVLVVVVAVVVVVGVVVVVVWVGVVFVVVVVGVVVAVNLRIFATTTEWKKRCSRFRCNPQDEHIELWKGAYALDMSYGYATQCF